MTRGKGLGGTAHNRKAAMFEAGAAVREALFAMHRREARAQAALELSKNRDVSSGPFALAARATP